jgi:hypothetical protein
MEYGVKKEKEWYGKYCNISLPGIAEMRVEGKTDRLHDRKALGCRGHAA